MVNAEVVGGLVITWGADHRDGNGTLIVRQASVREPAPINCIKPRCLARYIYKSLLYTMLLLYHQERVIYAEAHRKDIIPDKYRTGEDSPKTIRGNIWEIMKLKSRR